MKCGARIQRRCISVPWWGLVSTVMNTLEPLKVGNMRLGERFLPSQERVLSRSVVWSLNVTWTWFVEFSAIGRIWETFSGWSTLSFKLVLACQIFKNCTYGCCGAELFPFAFVKHAELVFIRTWPKIFNASGLCFDYTSRIFTTKQTPFPFHISVVKVHGLLFVKYTDTQEAYLFNWDKILRLSQLQTKLILYLPDSEHSVPPLPSPWPVVYIYTGDSGTRFSPAKQRKYAFMHPPHQFLQKQKTDF